MILFKISTYSLASSFLFCLSSALSVVVFNTKTHTRNTENNSVTAYPCWPYCITVSDIYSNFSIFVFFYLYCYSLGDFFITLFLHHYLFFVLFLFCFSVLSLFLSLHLYVCISPHFSFSVCTLTSVSLSVCPDVRHSLLLLTVSLSSCVSLYFSSDSNLSISISFCLLICFLMSFYGFQYVCPCRYFSLSFRLYLSVSCLSRPSDGLMRSLFFFSRSF